MICTPPEVLMSIRMLAPFLVLSYVALSAGSARAETYKVGPNEAYATIQDTLDLLMPGDVVEVTGGQTYPGDLWFREDQSGTPDMPVTVRGIPVDGQRPILSGVGSEQYHDMVVLLNASHFVFEGFEIAGDGDPEHQGLVHKADGVVVRDVVVHGVGSHGLLGTDFDSGSLTLERCEFFNNGNGLYDHQIYMATDESVYPGSVFRMQHCYVHDGAGGNNVKSRSERNEIYYNWIEGAVYHELDLIGPDGQDPGLAREDSDIVGNVLIKHSEWRIARIGGDGTGNTAGRYRFVNNTIVLGDLSETAFGLQETVESLELHNNVIIRIGPAGASLVDHNEPSGPDPVFLGSRNWIADGFVDVPPGVTDGLGGADPGFTDLASFDLRPVEASPLVDAGTDLTTALDPGVPNPLALPTFIPPARMLADPAARPVDAIIDIGAYEQGAGDPPGPGETGDTGDTGDTAESGSDEEGGSDGGNNPTTGQGDSAGSEGEGEGGTPTDAGETGAVPGSSSEGSATGSGGDAEEDGEGCGCRSQDSGASLVWWMLVPGLAMARVRRDRARSSRGAA